MCLKCNKLKVAGEISKCETCGKWINFTSGCDCYKQTATKIVSDIKCLTCDNKATNGFLCVECYKKMLVVKDQIDKNEKSYEIRDYYYNLKNYLQRKFWSKSTNSYLKLFALAIIAKDIHKDNSLMDRVSKDILSLIHKSNADKERVKEPNKQAEIQENDKLNNPGVKRALDGHFVMSEGERIVDDILYNADIIHTYQKKVIPITERTVIADWFIPVNNKTIGIYVEYWGVEGDLDYDDNKKEKQALYAKHKLKLIEIHPAELQKDSQSANDNILMEIRKLKKELIEQYN